MLLSALLGKPRKFFNVSEILWKHSIDQVFEGIKKKPLMAPKYFLGSSLELQVLARLF